MKLEYSDENRKIQQAFASLAIEDMFPSEQFLREIMNASNGDKPLDELRQEVIREYGRQ